MASKDLEKEITPRRGRPKSKNPPLNTAHVSYSDVIKVKLEEIRSQTDKSSVSEVFRQAIIFYALAFEEHQKGADLLIRSKDGEIERLRLFL